MLLKLSFIFAYAIMIASFNFALNADSGYLFEKLSFVFASTVLLVQRKKIYTNLLLLFLTVVVIVAVGSMTNYPDFEWRTLITALNQIFVLYAILSIRFKDKDSGFFLYLFSFLPLADLALGVVYHIADIHPMFVSEYSTGAFRLQGTLIPAYLSGVAMCGVVAAFFLAFNNKRAMVWLLVVANMGIAMLAGGRGTC